MPEQFSSLNEHSPDDLQKEVPPPVEAAPADAEPVASENPRKQTWRKHHIVLATLSVFVLLLVLLTVTGKIDTLAQNLFRHFSPAQPVADLIETASGESGRGSMLTFSNLDMHPDIMFQPYTAGPIIGEAAQSADRIQKFRALMELYQQRQAEDDNFTIRVVDARDGSLLEIFTLEAERERYRETGRVHWHTIDQLRSREVRRLVDKYVARGVPRAAVTVKFGRSDQVKEARQNEERTILYEIRLARYLGLSLLPTEIGTVETFNQDQLVSSVGARGRYQMMPAVLRENGIRHYDLQTASGNRISVYEEWNPLLTMESSFVHLKGYINAVGHEIPGISAYHTGPGNIYKLYQMFLTRNAQNLNGATTVMDAYMWGVTDGFEVVNEATSFGDYSRGYVASAYGSLKAVEDEPIDTIKTLLTERVQLREGQQIYLSQLLRTLDKQRDQLALDNFEDLSLYNIFREMNPHIVLPAPTDSVGVPVRGDINLTSKAGAADVRFFLPLGSSRVLNGEGVDILDETKTFVFDHNTFRDPRLGDKTMWDREYDNLVQDIGRFGFTRENRSRLISLRSRFQQMYEQNPSHYRKLQLEIIRLHENVWQWGPWNDIAAAVSSARGRLRPEAEPPTPLPTSRSATGVLGL
jgi:hypothetical protein